MIIYKMKTTVKGKPHIITLTVDPNDLLSNWRTVLFNCNCHIYERVVDQIIKAIGCTRDKAENLTFCADKTGSVIVCTGNRAYCENVARVLRDIDLNVTVLQE